MYINTGSQLSNTAAGLVSTNYRTTLFRQGRIPRKARRAANEEDKPGYLCWGRTGSLPSGEPVPTVGFNVVKETHNEIGRKTDPIRIENPDDPEQYVNALQTKSMDLRKEGNAPKDNTDTKEADIDPSLGSGFAKKDTAGGATTYRINFRPQKDEL